MGYDNVHAWAIERVTAVDPRLEPTVRFRCIDDASGRATSLDDWYGVDRGFDVRMPAEGIPTPDPEFQTCCHDCQCLITRLAIRRRYKGMRDLAALTRKVGVDTGQIIAALMVTSEWHQDIYDVEFEEGGGAIDPVRIETPVPTGPGLAAPNTDPEVAYIVTTYVNVYYTENG